MERNKLEAQFKEQLNSREIKPSEMAWDKLNAMLSVAEKPKAKFPWIYVAASFVGFFFIGTIYFTQKENTIENLKNGVVIQQSISTKSNKGLSKVLNPNSENSKYEVVAVARKVAVKTYAIPILKKDSLINKNNQNQVAELSIINQKIEQESISSQTNAVTVDELLARVDKSARLNNKTNPNLEVQINANHLLEQVDKDLEPIFRQSVFSKIADNFKAVKEAVVNRNKE
jgi:hypothetical protein